MFRSKDSVCLVWPTKVVLSYALWQPCRTRSSRAEYCESSVTSHSPRLWSFKMRHWQAVLVSPKVFVLGALAVDTAAAAAPLADMPLYPAIFEWGVSVIWHTIRGRPCKYAVTVAPANTVYCRLNWPAGPVERFVDRLVDWHVLSMNCGRVRQEGV